MAVLRTKQELARARWADKYTSVAAGKQYILDDRTGTTDETSPFPLHGYFQNKLLGKDVKMLELNAGHALVEQMVADTITEMKIQVGDKPADQDLWDWLSEIDYVTLLEESARDYYGTGYCVQQPIRTPDEEYTVTNVDPASWYPTIPALVYQDIDTARMISIFDEGQNQGQKGIRDWYAFVETHTIGKVQYQLYKIEREMALEGTLVDLSKIPRFAGLPPVVDTGLEYLALFQANRKKNSRFLFGQSVLMPIWDILQEVSQIQTHIRQEIIKHGRAKMHAPMAALQRSEHVNAPELIAQNAPPMNSKQLQRVEAQGSFYNANQDIFPIPTGATPPGYIMRDLQFIEKGSMEIDKLLARAASIVGCSKSIFNLDERTSIHVDTDKRKDRRYVRQVTQGQKHMAVLAKKVIETWMKWTANTLDGQPVTVTFSSPFETSQQERVDIMREMNPAGVFVSEQEAMRQIWTDKKPDELDALLKEIDAERTTAQQPLPGSALNQPPKIQL